MCGFFCSDWVKLQTTHLQQLGSRQCAKKWATQLAGKLIYIVFDMWDHRNEILHKKENSISEQKHEELNRMIEQIYFDLPNSTFSRSSVFSHFRQEISQKKSLMLLLVVAVLDADDFVLDLEESHSYLWSLR